MHVLAPNEFRVCSAVTLISWGLYWHRSGLILQKREDTLIRKTEESLGFSERLQY